MAHSTIELRTDDGTCPAHLFTPDGDGPWPGVLFYMDGIGMRPALVEMGERMARGGYYVLLPDLFYRGGPYTAPDPKALFTDEATRNAWFAKIMSLASAELIMRDTRAFLGHLEGDARVRGKRFGVTGYCMGGRMALAAAGHFGERIAAAAAYHPGNLANDAPDSPHLLASKMKARIYVGAASNDRSFPDEQKQRLDRALTEAGVDHVIETYAANHGWVPSDTPAHDDAAAERHWQTLFALFARTLGGA
ncbi:MAG TPA: dienelactone hydrolase family protein [Polyangia bacterium]|jgi:carboxymethylenebutenolidase